MATRLSSDNRVYIAISRSLPILYFRLVLHSRLLMPKQISSSVLRLEVQRAMSGSLLSIAHGKGKYLCKRSFE